MRRAVFAALAALALSGSSAGVTERPRVLLAAGDIASCASDGDERTARLVLARPRALVLALGDTVYERGTDDEYERCYGPSWGQFKARTRPVIGNHEYLTDGAAGYFRYFGRAAGPRRGYHSFDYESWHVVVLNSNCRPAGGCAAGSPQEQWLRRDLAAHPSRCTLAAMHHPRFSSGLHGDDRSVDRLWRTLQDGGADILLSGHDHDYERFAPRRGLRLFVVGTGGRGLYPVVGRTRYSEVRQWGVFGVLSLALGDGRYDWDFLAVDGGFRDRGSGRCR